MNHHASHKRSTLVLLFLLLVSILVPHMTFAADDHDSVTAGRLGGTLQTFIDRFGDPVDINGSAGPIFVTEEFGYLSVQVDRIQGSHGREDRARVITFGPQRSADTPADQVDAADWSVIEATDRANELLPTDASMNSPTDADGDGFIECKSQALKEIFGAVTLGECRISLIKSSQETVSFVTLTMTGGAAVSDETSTSAPNCAGVLEWIKQSGTTFTKIQSLLNQVSGLDEKDPDSAMQLTELSATFRQLADQQRELEVPDELSEAGFYLVSGLNSYAQAFEVASTAVTTGDAALADDAVSLLQSAQKAVDNAIAAVVIGADLCGLDLGTPVP